MQSWLVIRSQKIALSFRIKVRVLVLLLLLALITCIAMAVNISVGEYPIPLQAVFETLFGNGSRQYTFIVMTLRLPRTLVAVLVGMGMAASGAILQGLTRNPLASPDIIGVSSGASLFAVAVIILFSSAPLFVLPFAAFAGAACAALLVYWLAWRGGTSPTRLILVGIGVAAVAQALVQILISESQIIRVSQALIWLVGSVYGRSWEHFWPLLPWVSFFLPLTLLLSRHLDALHLGDDLARGLGSHVERQRAILLVASVALAGGSVATAGTIGFVGLMAPHIARILVGPSHNGLLPVATLIGGLIVVLADILGRVLFAPIEIPCGVITAAVGAPYFIWLLIRSKHL